MKKLLTAILLTCAPLGAQADMPQSCMLRPDSTDCVRDLEAQLDQTLRDIREMDRLIRQHEADSLRFWIDDDARQRREEERDQLRMEKSLKLNRIYCYPFCKGDER
jgi:hypothetical protein